MKEGNSVIRIKFAKYGMMRYIGHLDTMRFFQRLIRRAGIDAAYSEGFSPHQIMSFAQPLGVGVESCGEYMDLEVRSLGTASDMRERMNAECAEGIEIREMSLLPEKHEKAMASVYAADYRVVFRPSHEPAWDICAAVDEFNKAPSVKVMKKSKKSIREVELKELVYSLSVCLKPIGELFPEGPLSGDVIEDNERRVPLLHMRLSASSGDNVKPELLINALGSLSGSEVEEIGRTDLFITREELYDKEMKALIEAGTGF
ncbi:MAG: TIGR03936 family radical SAM-associated protein [Lachnospiraceae bacterium]|nr:TIGR03936 family radical SAM-associated protein [Lachnospiraceae bacterium]